MYAYMMFGFECLVDMISGLPLIVPTEIAALEAYVSGIALLMNYAPQIRSKREKIEYWSGVHEFGLGLVK